MATAELGIRLAFLTAEFFDKGATIRGGLLITDDKTRPYEFRCTSSIKPTTLQRMLYGDTLEEYIHVELIGLPLLNASKEKPTLVLVQNPSLVQIRPLVPYPVALIKRDSKSELGTVDSQDQQRAPIVLVVHRDFSSERAIVQADLENIIRQRDLIEPFDRLRIALNEAHRQGIGDHPTEEKGARITKAA